MNIKGKLEELYGLAKKEKDFNIALGCIVQLMELNGSDAPKVQEKPTVAETVNVAEAVEDEKPETTKQKKGRGKGKGKAAGDTAKSDVTVDSVRALAKKIALTSGDPKECMIQIREVVSEVAESCYENANVGYDKFDLTGLILLQEELVKFVYTSPEPEAKKEEEAADDLEI